MQKKFLEEETSSGIYIKNLTGIRAFAVLWVIIYHGWGISGAGPIDINLPFGIKIGLTHFAKAGAFGVDIFFVLSGFLLTLPILKNQKPFLKFIFDFYRRRALRILPAYYAILLAMLYLCLFGFGPLPSASYMLGHVFFINSWWNMPPIRGVFWTLPLEVSFYLLLPFIALNFTEKRWLGTLIFFIAFSILFKYFLIKYSLLYNHFNLRFIYSLPARIDEFVIGGIAAYLFYKNKIPNYLNRWLFPIGILGIFLIVKIVDRRGDMLMNGDPIYSIHHTLFAISVALAMIGATVDEKFSRFIFGNKIIFFIGEISYSLYLWHTVIMDMFYKSGLKANVSANNSFFVSMLYILPPTFIISVASYWMIERKFLIVRNQSPNLEEPTIRNPIFILIIGACLLIGLAALTTKIYQINH